MDFGAQSLGKTSGCGQQFPLFLGLCSLNWNDYFVLIFLLFSCSFMWAYLGIHLHCRSSVLSVGGVGYYASMVSFVNPLNA